MNLIKKVQEQLTHSDVTYIAYLQTGEEFHSMKHGIAPIMEQLALDDNVFENATVGDKVIGKAAALLLIKANIKELFANVISEHALQVLDQYKIPVQYVEKVPYIRNRAGDGMCPMENTVLTTNDPDEAYVLLKEKLKSMLAATRQ